VNTFQIAQGPLSLASLGIGLIWVSMWSRQVILRQRKKEIEIHIVATAIIAATMRATSFG
jgi:hypothetical protein